MRLLASSVLLFGMAGTVAAAAVPQVHPWAPPAVSSDQWESHPAFDPLTGDLWFVRSDKNFAGWRILVSHCSGGTWTKPMPMPFAAPGLEADPHFTPDSKRFYFISTRATGSMHGAALDIWMAQRTPEGHWLPPVRLPAPVNSDAAEWFPRPAKDGWLYFGSNRKGGWGKDDIWRARQDAHGKWIVENAGPGLNTAGEEYEFEPAPDGTWGILSAADGLYRVEMTAHGWQRREKYGKEINATGTEIGPLIAPDGKSFLFSRDTGKSKSGELFVAQLTPTSGWPREWQCK